MASDSLFPDLLRQPTPINRVVEQIVSQNTPNGNHRQSKSPTVPTILGPRENPWARIGHVFPPTSDPVEALNLSRLDWNVEKVGLRTDDLTPVHGQMAIRRTDNGRVLGVVGDSYEVFSNHEMVDLLSNIAGEGRIQFEAGGAFGHGDTVYVQAKLPDHDVTIGQDRSIPWMTISTGHTGNRTMTIMPTLLRCACFNTLKMAIAERADARRRHPGLSNGYNVRHSRGMREALADIAAAYAGTLKSLEVTRSAYRYLASKQVTARQVDRYFDAVFPTGPDETDRSRAIAKARRERLENLWAGPTSRITGTDGSAYALLNVATEFVDHLRPTKADEGVDPVEARIRSATFSSGADVKSKAWDAIFDLVGG
jgi:phage/plasmid-like protein (TIGR03299 family)